MLRLNPSHLKVEDKNAERNSSFSFTPLIGVERTFMSLGTCSNKMLGQFVNSDVF